jgi:hypothetical protein
MKKIIKKEKKRVKIPPPRKVNMGGGPFVGRSTTG